MLFKASTRIHVSGHIHLEYDLFFGVFLRYLNFKFDPKTFLKSLSQFQEKDPLEKIIP